MYYKEINSTGAVYIRFVFSPNLVIIWCFYSL